MTYLEQPPLGAEIVTDEPEIQVQQHQELGLFELGELGGLAVAGALEL
jgi:hypothetical protein